MFVQAAPSSPTVSTSSIPPSPIGPARPSRLRGLTYLRTYTQHHLSSLSQQTSTRSDALHRTISYPANPITATADTPPVATSPPLPTRGRFPVVSDDSEFSRSGTGPSQRDSGEAASEDNTGSGAFSRIMARHRAGSAPQGSRRNQTSTTTSTTAIQYSRSNGSNPVAEIGDTTSTGATRDTAGLVGLPQDQMPTIKFIPHQDPRAARPSLTFGPTSRTLPHEDCVIRVGRYSERDGNPNPPANIPSSAPVGFKSKVVSRRHCEFWCSQGQWYIKDVKSSSGTFLNHIRLSQPSVESRPFPVNDGDVVQLGIDFRGGEEMIFRCVKIRVECNRAWQKGLNNFNVTTHKRLRALARPDTKKDSDAASTHSSECAICLMSIAPCQSLFVAPCSHVWHYKCIRPILNNPQTYPQFLCPNCRAVADLEVDVDDLSCADEWEDEEEEVGDEDSSPDGSEVPRNDINGIQPQNSYTNARDVDAEVLASVDEVLAAQTRHLSISELVNSSEPSSSSTRPNIPPGPSIISRRLASKPPYGAVGDPSSVPSIAGTMNLAGQQDRLSQHFRPATADLASRSASHSLLSVPVATSDALASEGPMTPRNDIGPFVFDGSAGRSLASHVNGVVNRAQEGMDDIL